MLIQNVTMSNTAGRFKMAKMHYCYRCQRTIHSLGLPRHRAMHRDKKENCSICTPDGRIIDYHFSKINEGKE